eukprot:8926827-Pyramimonas_sp.AAC.1
MGEPRQRRRDCERAGVPQHLLSQHGVVLVEGVLYGRPRRPPAHAQPGEPSQGRRQRHQVPADGAWYTSAASVCVQ